MIADEVQSIVRDLWTLRLELLKDLLNGNAEDAAVQMFSTQTDTDDTEHERYTSRATRAAFHTKPPHLIESLALIYLALVIMRLPCCASDLLQWVLHEDFVFLRATNAVPQSMMQQLPQQLRYQFEPRVSKQIWIDLICD